MARRDLPPSTAGLPSTAEGYDHLAGSGSLSPIASVQGGCRRRRDWAIFFRHDIPLPMVGLPSPAERLGHPGGVWQLIPSIAAVPTARWRRREWAKCRRSRGHAARHKLKDSVHNIFSPSDVAGVYGAAGAGAAIVANVLPDDESIIVDKSKKQPQFVRFGKCTKCIIRNAARRLIGPNNENYEIFCERCARAQIRKIEKDIRRLRADKKRRG